MVLLSIKSYPSLVGEETVEEEDAEVVVDAVADGDLLLFNAYNASVKKLRR
jgi:hypothetical protein